MEKKLIRGEKLLDITINRLCQELLENHQNFENSVLIGLQPKGVFLAERIRQKMSEITQKEIDLGYLDVTFYRDDFRRRDAPLRANTTKIPFVIEDKEVILIDDVLFTGRSVRSALDAILAFGRPRKVDFLVLIDRKYTRDLPIEATYVGVEVNTLLSQRVEVELKEQGFENDNIWLVEKP